MMLVKKFKSRGSRNYIDVSGVVRPPLVWFLWNYMESKEYGRLSELKDSELIIVRKKYEKYYEDNKLGYMVVDDKSRVSSCWNCLNTKEGFRLFTKETYEKDCIDFCRISYETLTSNQAK